jgi:hypothetical protein
MTDRPIYIEEKIINAVKALLSGRVNELIQDTGDAIPPVEFNDTASGGPYGMTPVLKLTTGERSEKDRIIKTDVYVLTISFTVPDGERDCYAYADVLSRALGEDTTLEGTVDRAVLIKKNYVPPKRPNCGEGWELELTIHIRVEGTAV